MTRETVKGGAENFECNELASVNCPHPSVEH